jgi:hypothetical protein
MIEKVDLTVVHGQATPEEIAAVLAVIARAGQAAAAEPAPATVERSLWAASRRPASGWTAQPGRARDWRTSFWPR